MEEFTQAQAAMLSGYDEREFRSLIDKRIILPSPATRNFGRGKLKTFLRHEVRVASILRGLDHRLSTYQKASIADWIRQSLLDQMRGSSKDQPCFVVVELDDGGWRGAFRLSRGYIYNGTDNGARDISILIQDEKGENRPMRNMIGTNINHALWWDNDDMLKMVFSPPASGDDAPNTSEQ